MSPQSVIDSHVHLWPESMSNEESHAWMTPGMPLVKQHILPDYYASVSQSNPSDTVVEGVVYVETDVRYQTPRGASEIRDWAKGPLDEIRFLRAIVDGGYGAQDSKMLVGIVAWAPMDQGTEVLEEWLRAAEEAAGRETWKRMKGFRFLLQFIVDQEEFERLVLSSHFVENLKLLGRRGLSFDIGVDQHSGGVWQLESMSKAMARAHDGVLDAEKVIFISNHLCKPDFELDGAEYARWRKAVETMSKFDKTYMKLSGAFSELPDDLDSVQDIASHMKPWVGHVLDCFKPEKIMFGSDWPVCNVKRQKDSWGAWRDVITLLLDESEFHLSKSDKDKIWKGTAQEAYRLS